MESRAAAQFRSVPFLPPWQHSKSGGAKVHSLLSKLYICPPLDREYVLVHLQLNTTCSRAVLIQLFGHCILIFWISRNCNSCVGMIIFSTLVFLVVFFTKQDDTLAEAEADTNITININIAHAQSDAEAVGSRRSRGATIQRASLRRGWEVAGEMMCAMQSGTITH